MSCQCDKAEAVKTMTKDDMGKMVHYKDSMEMEFLPLFIEGKMVHYLVRTYSKKNSPWRRSMVSTKGFAAAHWYTP